MLVLDDHDQLEETTRIIFTPADTTTFQEQAAKPFIAHLKESISSSSNEVSAMNIFDARKAPNVDSDLFKYGEEAIGIFLAHYGFGKPAETLHGN